MQSVTVNVNSLHHRRNFLSCSVNGSQIRLQLDTASDITVISRRLWKRIGSPQLFPSSVIAKSASGDKLEMDGEFRATVGINGQEKQAVIFVATGELALLGIDLAEAFSLWSVPIDQLCNNVTSTATTPEGIVRKFPGLFKSTMGFCAKAEVTLHLKPNCSPVFCAKRPVAYAMRDAVDAELDRLERLNIITPELIFI
ncbi:uncharacterized protein K02A2.6-like [Anopheles arabiensis]|uniref:uncharacterized protein K02A2.6-like n=1 Tax=Anopheles arabiensis TaxID=7173 RepID=UPI001AAD80C9|nr:uncharacterized protein K02A2.6-like [Anopheles arabiensis]